MAVSGWKKSSALAALAVALAGLGVPTLALADDQEDGRRGGWAERRGAEAPGQIGEQRSWGRPQQQQQQQTQAPPPPEPRAQRAWSGGQGGGGQGGGGQGGGGQGGGWQGRQAPPPPQVESQAPPPRAWGGGQGGGWQGRRQNTETVAQPAPEARESGWRGQRERNRGGDGEGRNRNMNGGGQGGGDGERRNRNWTGGGQGGGGQSGGGQGGGQQGWTGPTPAPVPQTDGRVVNNGDGREAWRSRNRGYTDPNRNGSYGDRRRGDDNDRNWRDGDRRRDGGNGYTDGRRWDGDSRRGDGDRWRDGRRVDNDGRRWGNNDGRRWSGNERRRHGPGSSGYNPNRSSTWWNNYGWNNGTWRNNRHSYYNNGSWRNWDRNWRHDRRYDWNRWRSSHNDWFRLDYYYSPYRNYNYRRLSIGFFLDSLFYSERYWLEDPWQYRLPEVYGPYRWVRYYDDVLLVNIYSGEVVDVIHDFFW